MVPATWVRALLRYRLSAFFSSFIRSFPWCVCIFNSGAGCVLLSEEDAQLEQLGPGSDLTKRLYRSIYDVIFVRERDLIGIVYLRQFYDSTGAAYKRRKHNARRAESIFN